MNNFFNKVVADLRNPYYIAIIVFLLIIGGFFIQDGINVYNDQKDLCKDFEEFEMRKVEKAIEFINQGRRGQYFYTFICCPTPILAFTHSYSLYNTLICSIDNSGVVFQISEIPACSKLKQPRVIFDLSFYFLYLVSLFALAFGFLSFNKLSHFRLLSGSKKRRLTVFFTVSFSRLLILFLFLFSFSLVAILLFFINNISVTSSLVFTLYIYLLEAAIPLTFLMSIGFLFGMCNHYPKGIIFAFLSWIVFILIAPVAINKLIPSPKNKSIFKVEAEKIKILDDFENDIYTNAKEITDRSAQIDYVNNMFKGFPHKEYESMKKLDSSFVDKIRIDSSKIQLFNIFIPTTFFSSISTEISSLGFASFFGICNHCKDYQNQLVEGYSKSHIENKPCLLYNSKSQLPKYYILGNILNIFYIIFSLFAVYTRFKGFLNSHSTIEVDNIQVDISPGDHIVFYIRSGISDFVSSLLRSLFNNSDLSISINNTSINKLKYFYLPDVSRLDYKFLCMLTGGSYQGIEAKKFSELSTDNLTQLIPSLSDIDLLIIDQFDCDSRFIRKGITIIELTSESVIRKDSKMFLIYPDGNKFSITYKKNSKSC